MMEEILFAIKPEMIVAMALCSYMHDEEAILISGARQYSKYSGYASSFEFQGDFEPVDANATPPIVLAMDALQGMAKIQFQEGLIRRDINKARVAFSCFDVALDGGAWQHPSTLATGNWGCGAFGNDHVLKFLQQWMAASHAGAQKMSYHLFNDKRAGEVFLSFVTFYLYQLLFIIYFFLFDLFVRLNLEFIIYSCVFSQLLGSEGHAGVCSSDRLASVGHCAHCRCWRRHEVPQPD
jgi:hypothetical protein